MYSKLTTLLFIIAFCLPINAAALERSEQIKIFHQRIEGMLKQGILPIIDTEFHFGDKVSPEAIIKQMDKNGVALIWLAPILRVGSEESLRLNKKYPDRFVPTTMNGDSKKWHGGNKKFLDKLEKQVRTGKYFAMGEFEARHYPSSVNSRNVHTPVDSAGMQVVFQLSSETGIAFSLHHEAEDALLPELEKMLAKYPKAKVIWDHVGRNRNYQTWKTFRSADAVRDFLTKYPNLYFDFLPSRPGSKYKFDGTGYGKKGYVEGIMYDYSSAKVKLAAEWKKVIEEFPDRFVIGSDANTGAGIAKFNKYDKVSYIYRDIILKGLDKNVAEKIAYKNWLRVIKETWK